MQAKILNIEQITDFAPEQYYVIDKMNKKYAYIRLRHGYLEVYAPDEDGELVYSAQIEAESSCFNNEHEKGCYMALIKDKLRDYYKQEFIFNE